MQVIVSLIRAFGRLVLLKLRFPRKYTGVIIRMEDGKEFTVFRHMKLKKPVTATGTVLVVRFRFSRFPHAVNKKLSLIPVPLIAGFPGFRDKIWMIDYDSGLWQGVYQFADSASVEKYKASFVLKLMNARTEKETVNSQILPDTDIDDYIKSKIVV